MYDAVTPANIPANAVMVAGYVDGRYAWHPADWERFPKAVKVRIACFSSTNDGNVLDIETGCSTPANAPAWVLRRRARGVDPSVYCSLSLWPTVRKAFHNARVTEPHYWIAAYPGNGPNLYPGAYAHQYANPGPVDISVVADYWPGIDPKPVPKPVVKTVPRFPSYNGGTRTGVAAIQRRLGNVIVDGIYGPITRNHVVLFQKAHRLTPDGIVGPITWRALWLA